MPAELWLCLIAALYILAMIDADRRCKKPFKEMRNLRAQTMRQTQRRGLRHQIDSLLWLKSREQGIQAARGFARELANA